MTELDSPPAAPTRDRPKIPTWVKTLLKMGFSGLVLWWFWSVLDVKKLSLFLDRAAPLTIAAVAALSLIHVALGAWRFRFLVKQVKDVPLSTLMIHSFIGATYNNLLPSAIGGDAVRVLLLRPYGVTMAQGASFIFEERIMGVWAVWFMGALALPFANLPTEPLLICLSMIFLTISLSALGIWAIFKAPDKWLVFGPLRDSRATIRETFRHPKEFVLALIGSFLFQWTAVYGTYLVSEAFSLGVPASAFYALIPLVYLVTLLPLSFGGVGLREASFVYLFGFVGVSMEASLILSLGTYVSLLLPGLFGLPLQLFLKSPVNAQAPQKESPGEEAIAS